jgi:hypothetical protein
MEHMEQVEREIRTHKFLPRVSRVPEGSMGSTNNAMQRTMVKWCCLLLGFLGFFCVMVLPVFALAWR